MCCFSERSLFQAASVRIPIIELFRNTVLLSSDHSVFESCNMNSHRELSRPTAGRASIRSIPLVKPVTLIVDVCKRERKSGSKAGDITAGKMEVSTLEPEMCMVRQALRQVPVTSSPIQFRHGFQSPLTPQSSLIGTTSAPFSAAAVFTRLLRTVRSDAGANGAREMLLDPELLLYLQSLGSRMQTGSDNESSQTKELIPLVDFAGLCKELVSETGKLSHRSRVLLEFVCRMHPLGADDEVDTDFNEI
jgi:hypothetical protein